MSKHTDGAIAINFLARNKTQLLNFGKVRRRVLETTKRMSAHDLVMAKGALALAMFGRALVRGPRHVYLRLQKRDVSQAEGGQNAPYFTTGRARELQDYLRLCGMHSIVLRWNGDFKLEIHPLVRIK